MQNTAQSILLLQVAEQTVKSVIVGKQMKLSAFLSGICSVLIFGGGLAVCLMAGEDYFGMGIPLGISGLVLCVLNAVISLGKEKK